MPFHWFRSAAVLVIAANILDAVPLIFLTTALFRFQDSHPYIKCLRMGSCGVAIGTHYVANLYQGELQ